MSELRKTLKQYRSEGRFDSEGMFTTSRTRAVGKLAAWQLPRPSAWILKVLQAAVASGSNQIMIKQSRRATVFAFDPAETVDLAVLSEALQSVKEVTSEPLRALAVGLRAVGVGQNRRFRVDAPAGVLEWSDQQLTLTPEANDRSGVRITVDFPRESRGRLIGNMIRSLGVATDEYLEVVHSAEASPIKIVFDGRRIDQFDLPAEDAKSNHSWCVARGWNSAGNLNLPPIGLPYGLQLPGACVPSFLGGPDAAKFSLEGEDPGEAAVLFKLHLNYLLQDEKPVGVPGNSHVSWLVDGIVTHFRPYRKKSILSFEIYLSGEDLKSDVSGMGLVRTQAMENRLSNALLLLRNQLVHLRAAIEARENVEHSLLNRIAKSRSLKKEKEMRLLLSRGLQSLISHLKSR